MKKCNSLLLIPLLLLTGCLNDSDQNSPGPDPMISYLNLFNFLMEPYDVLWEINDVIVESAHSYGTSLLGYTTLDKLEQEITFTIRESSTDRVIESQIYKVEQNQYHTLAFVGNEDDPEMMFESMDLRRPSSGMIKLRFLHAVMELGSLDFYIGGDTPEHKVISGASFAGMTNYLEATQEDLWKSLIVTPHDMLPFDSTLFFFTANEIFYPNHIYLGVIGHISNSNSSSLQLQFYNQLVD